MMTEKSVISKIIPLICIMVLAVFLRFAGLGEIPTGPYWDEAAIGYNAYSLLKTGRDEYGVQYPLAFRSFNDYKTPLYIYLTVPAVALFGLNIWSVRLTSAVFGVLAVAGTYFLAKELILLSGMQSKSDIYSKTGGKNNSYEYFRFSHLRLIPLFAAFFVAVSPWHIHFSRVAFESNLAVTLNIWGSVFFLTGLYKRRYLYLSLILFGLGLYSYHSERVFVPLYLFLLGIGFLSATVARSKEFVTSVFIFIVIAVPVGLSFKQSDSLQRFKSTNVFVKSTEMLTESVQKYNFDKAHGSLTGMFLNDRRIEWTKVFASGYLAHFSPTWLFMNGDLQRHHAPDSGLLYMYTLPFLIVGFVSLLGMFRRLIFFITGWILIAPVAATLTFEVPHAIRSFVFMPVFELVMAIGLWSIFRKALRIYQQIGRIGKVVFVETVLVALILGVFEMVRFGDLYFFHLNREFSQFWQYGYREVMDYIQTYGQGYDRVVFNTDLEQPYIFVLFYTKYSPASYLANGGSVTHTFGKYIFRHINWDTEITDGRTLYVDTVENSPHPNLKLISALDGSPLIAILDSH